VSYAFVHDVPASWEQYARFADALAEAPPGLILHAAGPTDEGLRIIDVWESEEAWRRFEAERLAALPDAATPSAASRFRALRPTHLIYGGKERGDA
jgi:hypothetical protein